MAEKFQDIRQAIAGGHHEAAWADIEPLLSFPASSQLTSDELAALLSFFERVCPTIATRALREVVHTTRESLDDLRSLTDLGEALFDHGFHGVAATPLFMANRLALADDCPSERLSKMLGQALARARTPLLGHAA